MKENHFLVIMAGGVGTRFWPESRSTRPKQFLDMLGTGKTLLRQTFERFQELFDPSNVYVVTSTRYEKLVAEDLPEIPASNILGEPVARNTAPCIAFAVTHIRKRKENAVVFVTSSDQFVQEADKLRAIVSDALDTCGREPILMTLGIRPLRPDTGYGYIQFKEEKSAQSYRKVKTFIEKPDLEVAKVFLESGEFLWNSGMFCFSLSTISDAYREFLPDSWELFAAYYDKLGSAEEKQSLEETYSRCKNISVDYGILEKAKNVYVIPAEITWSDLGTWGSAYEFFAGKDKHRNALKGMTLLYNSGGNLVKIKDPNKVVVIEGLEDFIVVDTGDALLICHRDKEQMVRDMVADVRKNFGEKFV